MGRHRSAWASLLVIGLVGAASGSGVLAVFSDVDRSLQNVLEGGTLDLRLDGGDGTTTFAVREAQAGETGGGATRVSNVGSIDGALDARIDNGSITNAPGVTYEPEPRPDEGEMGQVAEMAMFVDGDRDGIFGPGDVGLSSASSDPSSQDCLTYGPSTPIFDKVDTYEDCAWRDLAVLGDDVDFVVRWRMPEDAGNETMGDQVYIKYTFVLTQV